MNYFVQYLNSMNSANSDNKNALAEAQVTTEYYSKIAVKRNIADQIYDYLTSGHEAIILTGHAGDGKTSILIQILEKYGYFKNGMKPLSIEERFNDIRYIKDMSELNPNMQTKLLLSLLDAPYLNHSSIIVTNTGPLISAFNSLFEDTDASEQLEKKILHGIESVISDPIEFDLNEKKYKFRMINIANMDNIGLIDGLLENILDQSLWTECFECECNDRCPIRNNYRDVMSNRSTLTEQITRLYYWLSEKGNRLTIRQIVAHVSFSLTSNLSCCDIHHFSSTKEVLFKYSFANAFFGYDGLATDPNALNIKTIREIQNLKIDEKSLDRIDHQLFVREDLSCFDDSTKNVLGYILGIQGNSLGEFASAELRKAFRRYYIIFGRHTDKSINQLDSLIMSEAMIDYYKAVTSDHMDVSTRMKFEKIIFAALFRLFMGVYPTRHEETLYLSLRKDFHLIQNTQLLIGKVPKSDLSIVLKPKENCNDQELVKSELYLKFDGNKFRINAEFLDFLYKFYDGEVFTSLHPSFTYGLSRLKSDLLRKYRLKDESMELMIIQKDRMHRIRMKIDGSKIYVS